MSNKTEKGKWPVWPNISKDCSLIYRKHSHFTIYVFSPSPSRPRHRGSSLWRNPICVLLSLVAMVRQLRRPAPQWPQRQTSLGEDGALQWAGPEHVPEASCPYIERLHERTFAWSEWISIYLDYRCPDEFLLRNKAASWANEALLRWRCNSAAAPTWLSTLSPKCICTDLMRSVPQHRRCDLSKAQSMH